MIVFLGRLIFWCQGSKLEDSSISQKRNIRRDSIDETAGPQKTDLGFVTGFPSVHLDVDDKRRLSSCCG